MQRLHVLGGEAVQITVQYSFRAVSGSLLAPSCRGAAVAGAAPPTAGPSAALWGPGASGDGTSGWRGPMAVVAAAVAAQESRTAAAAAIDGGDVDAEAVQGCEGVGDGWRSRPIAKGRVCMNLHVWAMMGTGIHEYSFGHGAGGRLCTLVPYRPVPLPSLLSILTSITSIFIGSGINREGRGEQPDVTH